jgi:hypothetical protein
MLLWLGANDGSTQHAVGGTRRYYGDMTNSPHLVAANDVYTVYRYLLCWVAEIAPT